MDGIRDGIPATLEHLAVDIRTLRPHPRNARVHDDEGIQDSLRRHGQYRPVVVARDGVILAGNGTYAAAMALGWERLAATRLDLDAGSDEAIRILLVDNRLNDVAQYDDGLLLDLLQGLPDLEGTSYDAAALDELVASVARREATPLLPEFKEFDETAADDLPTEMCQQCGRLCVKEKRAPEPTH